MKPNIPNVAKRVAWPASSAASSSLTRLWRRRYAYARPNATTTPSAHRISGTSVCAPMTTRSWLGKIPSAGAAGKPAARSRA